MDEKKVTEKKPKAAPKAESKPAPKAEKKPKADDRPKYGVEELAKELGITAASARVALRNHDVEKDGKRYGWNNDKDFKAVVHELRPKKA